MNDDPGFDVTIPNGLQSYESEKTVYRAALYDYWLLDNKSKVSPRAFYRKPKDKHGLSVNPTENDCRNNPALTLPIHGVIQLVAREIRTIQKKDGSFLEVVPNRSNHGNIKRVPHRDGIGNNDADAVFISRRLAEQANSRTIL